MVPRMRRISAIFMTLCLFVLCGATMAPAQEGETRYQVQIGSAKQLKGTKYFAAKASRVLDTSVYVIHRGQYFVALTGHYSTREQAQERLMEIRQHYNGMVVEYELGDIVAAFSSGQEIPERDIVRKVFAGERALKAREKLMQTQPIREVTKKQSTGLRGVVEEGLVHVRMDGCSVVNTEQLSGFEFRTVAKLAELDPYSLATEERHGANLYIVVKTKGNLNKVSIEQFTKGKSVSKRSEDVLSLKLKSGDVEAIEKVSTALRELMLFCTAK